MLISIDSGAAQSKIIAGRMIHVLSNDKQCFELVESSMAACVEGGHQHEKCLVNEPHQLRSRVINVGLGEKHCSPSIFVDSKVSGAWATLSCRWG